MDHTWPFEKLADADADADARFQFQGEALFTPLRARGNKTHRDPRGKTTKVADRRRGHHIAKAEGASRMYREVILKIKSDDAFSLVFFFSLSSALANT